MMVRDVTRRVDIQRCEWWYMRVHATVQTTVLQHHHLSAFKRYWMYVVHANGSDDVNTPTRSHTVHIYTHWHIDTPTHTRTHTTLFTYMYICVYFILSNSFCELMCYIAVTYSQTATATRTTWLRQSWHRPCSLITSHDSVKDSIDTPIVTNTIFAPDNDHSRAHDIMFQY